MRYFHRPSSRARRPRSIPTPTPRRRDTRRARRTRRWTARSSRASSSRARLDARIDARTRDTNARWRPRPTCRRFERAARVALTSHARIVSILSTIHSFIHRAHPRRATLATVNERRAWEQW